jgi:hypothetical protein
MYPLCGGARQLEEGAGFQLSAEYYEQHFTTMAFRLLREEKKPRNDEEDLTLVYHNDKLIINGNTWESA